MSKDLHVGQEARILRSLDSEERAEMDAAATRGVNSIAAALEDGKPLPEGMILINNPGAPFNMTLSRHDIPEEHWQKFGVPEGGMWHHRLHIPKDNSVIHAFLKEHFALKMHNIKILRGAE